MLSYWESKYWFQNIDFTVVGSGIVGINCALQLRTQYPKSKILVLERGSFPYGATTRNAGFACFGSISELLSDLKQTSEAEMVELVTQRHEGLQYLRKMFGDTFLKYEQHGGKEVFLKKDELLYDESRTGLERINKILSPIFQDKVFVEEQDTFGFNNTFSTYITNVFEGQIDTSKLAEGLLHKLHQNSIIVLNGVTVHSFEDAKAAVSVSTSLGMFTTRKLCIATNGFAQQLGIEGVQPARAQVLITKPITNLHIKGTFHIDQGYYYFRKIDDRILLGGGRNLDFEEETTTKMECTNPIQNALDHMLQHVILPKTPFEIDTRWAGIMGVGTTKKPIVKHISENVVCGVKLGGMGIAIGSYIGVSLAKLLEE